MNIVDVWVAVHIADTELGSTVDTSHSTECVSSTKDLIYD